jgi:hypothetical protein
VHGSENKKLNFDEVVISLIYLGLVELKEAIVHQTQKPTISQCVGAICALNTEARQFLPKKVRGTTLCLTAKQMQMDESRFTKSARIKIVENRVEIVDPNLENLFLAMSHLSREGATITTLYRDLIHFQVEFLKAVAKPPPS